MKKISLVAVLFILSLSCSSTSSTDSSDSGGSETTVEATLSSIQANIFTPTCALSGCHASGSSSGGLSLTEGEAFGELVGVASTEAETLSRVAVGNPDQSYIINKLEGTQTAVGGSGDQMPRGGSALSDEKIQAIRDWITNGAENN